MKKRYFKIGTILNYFFLLLLAVLMFYPFYYVVIYSISTYNDIVGKGAILRPYGVTLEAIRAVLTNKNIYTAYANTIFIVVVGTGLSVLTEMLMAYPLARKVKGHRVISFLVYFTMLFNGGLIPTYYIVRSTGLLNSIWSVIIPVLVNPFYIFLIRAYYQGLPDSLIESATIDGASEARTFVSIILPMCSPIIATITLMTAVAHWNSWFTASLYIRDAGTKPLQLIIRELLIQTSDEMSSGISSQFDVTKLTPSTLRMAMVTVSTLPIVCLYPFLQKYFVKGVTLGAVKG